MKNNIASWFEIPVTDMDRAIRFYETVFDFPLSRQQMGALEMAWFPSFNEKPGAAGTLIYNAEWYTPSAEGVLIYLSSQTGDLADELARVEDAGGQIIIPKRQISEEIGYMAVFKDSEGNRVALHSPK